MAGVEGTMAAQFGFDALVPVGWTAPCVGCGTPTDHWYRETEEMVCGEACRARVWDEARAWNVRMHWVLFQDRCPVCRTSAPAPSGTGT